MQRVPSPTDNRPMPTSVTAYGPTQIFSPVGPVSANSDKIRDAIRIMNTRYISLWHLGFLSAGMQLVLFLLAPEQAMDGATTVANRLYDNVQYWAPCLLAVLAMLFYRRNRTVHFLDNLFANIAMIEQNERSVMDHTMVSPACPPELPTPAVRTSDPQTVAAARCPPRALPPAAAIPARAAARGTGGADRSGEEEAPARN